MTNLGCSLDETLSGESMVLKVINKINSRLRFLYRKNSFLFPPLCRLLYNSLIQPRFDYACLAWYPNLNKRLKSKSQILQNKCIQFCLNLNNWGDIRRNEFEKINWVPVNDHFEQIISSISFKFYFINLHSILHCVSIIQTFKVSPSSFDSHYVKRMELIKHNQMNYG